MPPPLFEKVLDAIDPREDINFLEKYDIVVASIKHLIRGAFAGVFLGAAAIAAYGIVDKNNMPVAAGALAGGIAGALADFLRLTYINERY